MTPKNTEKTGGEKDPGGDSKKPAVCDPEVEELQKALAFAQKKLNVVGSVTRHDVLNQLTAIMGYNELVSTMVQDEKILNFLTVERKASDKIRRILAYSKVFQNIGTEPSRWIRLDVLVRIAKEELDSGSVAILVENGACSLFVDPIVAKVFFYLFENAIIHGQRTTEIRVRFQSGNMGAVLVIEDNGVGIAPDEKEKIFEKGFGKRTGWGLFVTREILNAHDMTIEETGTAGSGGRFEIRIQQDRIRISDDLILK